MRFCCCRCGAHKIIFTTKGDHFGEHHGARCATCHNPLTVRDLFFITHGAMKDIKDKVTVRSIDLPPESQSEQNFKDAGESQ